MFCSKNLFRFEIVCFAELNSVTPLVAAPCHCTATPWFPSERFGAKLCSQLCSQNKISQIAISLFTKNVVPLVVCARNTLDSMVRMNQLKIKLFFVD